MKKKEKLEPCKLNDVLDHSLSAVSQKAKRHETQIIKNIDKNIELSCDPQELSKVLTHLIDNSCDAIKDEYHKWVEVKSHEDSENLILSVIDSGEGISHEITNSIMEPYFTTKERGSGLGLSDSKSILEAHNSSLEYDYDADNTKFDIKIPKELLKESA